MSDIQNFAAAARRDINEQIAAASAAVLDGKCKTFDEYRYECGRIRGLRLAEDSITGLAQKAEEDER